MSQETHHETHIHTDSREQETKRISSNASSSMWFVIIIVLLFVASLNFVQVMSHDDGGHGGHGSEHATEHNDASQHPVSHGTEPNATHEADMHGETEKHTTGGAAHGEEGAHEEGAAHSEEASH